MSSRFSHRLSFSALALLAAAGWLGLPATPRASAKEIIRLGYTLQFENPAYRKEAVIAFHYLLGEALSTDSLSVQLQEFAEYQEGLEAVRSGRLDGTVVPGYALAALPEEQRNLFVPEIVVQRCSRTTERFLLASRQGSDLERLRGCTLRIVDRKNRGVPRFWLEAELRAKKGSSVDHYFSQVTDCWLSQEAVLPTFFGKADACLVAEDEFQLLNELNPQIAQVLSVVVTSPEVMPLLVVRHRDYHSIALPALIDRGIHLCEKPQGQQVFTLIQLSRFGRFREDEFRGTRELAAFARENSSPGEVTLR